jgi:excisionase family DNA binding protein
VSVFDRVCPGSYRCRHDDDEPAVKLTPAAAAKRLGVSARTLTRYVEAGRLECERTPGGHRRFDPAAIDALLAEANPPTPTELPNP